MRRPLAALALALIAGSAAGCAGPAAGKPPPTSGSAHPRAEVPGQVLDLRDWYLTLPTGASGKADTVLQPQLATYSSPFFQLDAAHDGVVLTSDAGGVTALPPVKPEVVTAQIHDAERDVIEIRVADNRLPAGYDDGGGEFVIDPAYVLGTPYDLRIVAGAGRIDVYYNGAHAGGAALDGDGWYFKTGSYLQSNVSRGDAADAVGQVVLYALSVTHTA